LLILALAGIVFVVGAQAQHVPREFQWSGEGGILSMLYGLLCPFAIIGVLFGLGIILSRSRELVFESTSGQIIKSLRLLAWERSVKHRYVDFDSVTWKPRRRGGAEGSTLYPIVLTGPQAELRLFEETRLEDARKTTREIGEFTGFKQKHWDAGLLTQGAESSAYADRLAKVRRRMSLIGVGPRWRVLRSEGSLEYVQTFEPFVRIITGLFAIIGACLLIWSLCASENLPNEQFWLGGIFFIVSVPFVLGRRGITIDVGCGVVRIWVRLLATIWSREDDLSAFSKVVVERQVEELNSTPCVVGRIVLAGHGDRRLVLFKLIFTEEIWQFAGEISGFTNVPLVSDVQDGDH
jgi:hypothetical protein